MDLRREQKKINQVIGILFIIVLASITAAAVMLFSEDVHVPSCDSTAMDLSEIDFRAKPAQKSLFSKFISPNTPRQFSYEIKKNLTISDDDSQAELLLKNPMQNCYLMTMALTLEESDTVVLRTGYLLPGQIIEKAALDEPLPPGEYHAIAYICAVDAVTRVIVGTVEQPVAITITA